MKNEIYKAVTFFLEDYTGDDANKDTIELVTDRVESALEALAEGNNGYYYDLLESSSTYVKTKLSADELEEYTEMLEGYVNTYS